MSTGKAHTVLTVSKPAMNIQIKVPKPKPFDGGKKDAKSWLKQVKKYFLAAGLSEWDDMHSAKMNAIA